MDGGFMSKKVECKGTTSTETHFFSVFDSSHSVWTLSPVIKESFCKFIFEYARDKPERELKHVIGSRTLQLFPCSIQCW
jgi:hypothetical protein